MSEKVTKVRPSPQSIAAITGLALGNVAKKVHRIKQTVFSSAARPVEEA
jgi:hypothetical protein